MKKAKSKKPSNADLGTEKPIQEVRADAGVQSKGDEQPKSKSVACCDAPACEEPCCKKDDSASKLKWAAVVVLLVVAIAMAYYFMSSTILDSGHEINQSEFKNIFLSAEKVYIIMDVRGLTNSTHSDNVLECGVDFAGSNGMGGKNVTPLSFSDDGCVTPNGITSMDSCLSMIKDGLSIHIKYGDVSANSTKYYADKMVVIVGDEYTIGTCGIWVPTSTAVQGAS